MSEVASRVRALREALELTQDELGRRAGHGANGRVYLSKIETGKNQLNTVASRDQLARGFGLSRDDLDAYLSGRSSLAATVGKAGRVLETPEPEVERRDTPPPPAPEGYDEREDAFEACLLWSLDRERHTVRDLDAVRSVWRGSAQMREPGDDLIALARIWLDAAASLRKQGKPVTLESLLLAVTVGLKNAQVSQTSKNLQTSVEEEWRQRADQAPKKI